MMNSFSGNLGAFLDVIAWSEIGPDLLAASDNGYNVIVGSTAENPDLFSDYSTHPDKLVKLSASLESTAAGRYQQLYHNWVAYRAMLNLPDFGPTSQDMIAVQQIKEAGAMQDIELGNFNDAIAKCAHLWASFTGAGYGQHEQKLADLRTAFNDAGGVFA